MLSHLKPLIGHRVSITGVQWLREGKVEDVLGLRVEEGMGQETWNYGVGVVNIVIHCNYGIASKCYITR